LSAQLLVLNEILSTLWCLQRTETSPLCPQHDHENASFELRFSVFDFSIFLLIDTLTCQNKIRHKGWKWLFLFPLVIGNWCRGCS